MLECLTSHGCWLDKTISRVSLIHIVIYLYQHRFMLGDHCGNSDLIEVVLCLKFNLVAFAEHQVSICVDRMGERLIISISR